MKAVLLIMTWILLACSAYSQSSESTLFICKGDTVRLKASSLYADSYQWYKDNEEIDGADSATITIKETGYYTAIAKNKAGCESDTSNKIYVGDKNPIANLDSAFVYIGKQVDIQVLNNDRKACMPLDTNSVRIKKRPRFGTLYIKENGIVEYTAFKDQTGIDVFEYDVMDKLGMYSNTTEVLVQVSAECAEVFPNPTMGDVYIRVINPAINSLRVMDVSGQILFKDTISFPGKTVSLDGYANSMYIIQLLENNKVSCTYKVLKKTE